MFQALARRLLQGLRAPVLCAMFSLRWRSTSPANDSSSMPSIGRRDAGRHPIHQPPGLYYVAKVRYFEEF